MWGRATLKERVLYRVFVRFVLQTGRNKKSDGTEPVPPGRI
jgi:hypothetical protein